MATIADMQFIQFIQLQQDYLTAKADWVTVKENFDRQQKLNTQQATSDKNLQTARAEFADVAIRNYAVNSLPQRCVVSFENKQYVFIMTGASSFELLAVDIGESSNGAVEIRNAAHITGMPIVQKGAYDLLMAMKNKAEE